MSPWISDHFSPSLRWFVSAGGQGSLLLWLHATNFTYWSRQKYDDRRVQPSGPTFITTVSFSQSVQLIFIDLPSAISIFHFCLSRLHDGRNQLLPKVISSAWQQILVWISGEIVSSVDAIKGLVPKKEGALHSHMHFYQLCSRSYGQCTQKKQSGEQNSWNSIQFHS